MVPVLIRVGSVFDGLMDQDPHKDFRLDSDQ